MKNRENRGALKVINNIKRRAAKSGAYSNAYSFDC
jgi:hypothetical protein